MRLVNGLEKPIDSLFARAINAQLFASALDQALGLDMREFDHLPFAFRHLPLELAARDFRSQVGQRLAFYLSAWAHFPRYRADVAFTAVAFSLEHARTFDLGHRCLEAFGRIARGDLSGHRLAGPPFFVEDPQLQVVPFGLGETNDQ